MKRVTTIKILCPINCYYTAGVLLLRNELAVLHLCGSAQYLDGDGECLQVAGACDAHVVDGDPVTVRWWKHGFQLPAY